VARNRKRAKERRSRRPATGPIGRPGTATARAERDPLEDLEAPGPLEHAAPDAELADAQLALGRPELARDADGEPDDDGYDEADEFDEDSDDGDGDGASVGLPGRGRELSAPGTVATARRASAGNRLITFLQGSWRELQRVQWPDRRQVVQATGVVIGFVIVAGVFLGVADSLAGKLVNLILK
jgi:preprotein translocase subunit SecE